MFLFFIFHTQVMNPVAENMFWGQICQRFHNKNKNDLFFFNTALIVLDWTLLFCYSSHEDSFSLYEQ